MIQTKRVYEPRERGDGQRFLVERLWPRGIKKQDLEPDPWLKEVAPSAELRGWYHQDPSRWREFKSRYVAELNKEPEAWQPILRAARRGNVTLLYSKSDTEHNSAVILKEYLDRKLTKNK